jgi:hypothetical protein
MLTKNVFFLSFFVAMFYFENRITKIPVLEANIKDAFCCQIAGNSNFTLFQMVYFFNAYSAHFFI